VSATAPADATLESTAGAAQTREADLVIIGAGPTGLYAAYYAGFRGMSVAVVDSLPEVGGQVAALYPEKDIFDVAGLPAIKGQSLVAALAEQANQWDPVFLLGSSATDLAHREDGVVVTTAAGCQVRAKAALITGGVGTFTPRELPVGAEYAGRGLRYFVPRLAELSGHEVVVVGGGDSAVDWALSLRDVARSVTLVHRRPDFRAHARSVTELRSSDVRILTPYEVAEVGGEGRLARVAIQHRETGERVELPAQSLVAALGFIADLGPVEQWGLDLRKRHILVDRTMRTNRPRVYAAGDIADYDGKVKLISVGFGEAATAVNNMAPLIDPRLRVEPGHSSDA
jgi:thioredoxin reductase (NADPH)